MPSNYTLQTVINTKNPIHLIADSEPRLTSNVATDYRLAIEHDGRLVLQGQFVWHEGMQRAGFTWQTIPTVDLRKSDTVSEGVF